MANMNQPPIISRALHWALLAGLGLVLAILLGIATGIWGHPIAVIVAIGVPLVLWAVTEPMRLRWRFGFSYLLLGITCAAILMATYSSVLSEVYSVHRLQRTISDMGGRVQLDRPPTSNGWTLGLTGQPIPEVLVKLFGTNFGKPTSIYVPFHAITNENVSLWRKLHIRQITTTNERKNHTKSTASASAIGQLAIGFENVTVKLIAPTDEELKLLSHYRGKGSLELSKLTDISMLSSLKGCRFDYIRLEDSHGRPNFVDLLSESSCDAFYYSGPIHAQTFQDLKDIAELPLLLLDIALDEKIAESLGELNGLTQLYLGSFAGMPSGNRGSLNSASGVPDPSLIGLAKSRSLKHLSTDQLDLACANEFAKQNVLESLDLNAPPNLDPAIITAISQVRSLKRMNIFFADNKITDLSVLRQLPNLNVLHVRTLGTESQRQSMLSSAGFNSLGIRVHDN